MLEECGATGTVIHHCWECKMVQPFWKTVWWFLTKLNILPANNQAIVFLGIYPKELKTYIHLKTCPKRFRGALLIIAKTWKQPRCSTVDEQIHKHNPENEILFSINRKRTIMP